MDCENSDNFIPDIQMADEDCEMPPCYVRVPRMADSIYLAAGGIMSNNPHDSMISSPLVDCRFSDAESDTSTVSFDLSSGESERMDSTSDNTLDEVNARPFSIHYCSLFLEEIACNIYELYSRNCRVSLSAVYKVLDSEYSTLTEEEFMRTVRNRIEILIYNSVLKEFQTKFLRTTEKFLKKVVEYNVNALFVTEDKTEETRTAVPNASLLNMIMSNRGKFQNVIDTIDSKRKRMRLHFGDGNFIFVSSIKALIFQEAIRNGTRCRVIIKPSDISAVTAHEHYVSFQKKLYKSRSRFNS